MSTSVRPIVVVASVVVAALVGLGPARADVERTCANGTPSGLACPPTDVVPSLEPRATAALWRQLVLRPRPLRRSAAVDCRPLRAVLYAANDWLRLATKLAAVAAPCADYAISIPPLTADKTRPRPDQAWRIRALGPNLHALAEVNMNAWAGWVAATGSTWYQAGVEARRRMAAAGYDVTQGDGWAVNELSSAVRRGDGTAREDARAFVHGLHDGDGTQPAARGAVFTVGLGQGTIDLSVYRAALQGWLQDAAFWTDMHAYVSDWSQELYGDVRNVAVPGASPATRRDHASTYLQHVRALAGAGPPAVNAARSYLAEAYSPLANAAWHWDAAFGWTAVSSEQMQSFVSTQVYALRHAAATRAGLDRWGFAWAPRNGLGLTSADFGAQTGRVLDRLAAAIRDTASAGNPGDPGVEACGDPETLAWCSGDIAGSWFNTGWTSLAAWATAPAAPALSGAAEPGLVRLSWQPPADGGSAITAYRVYRGPVGGSPELLATVGAVPLYDDSSVAGGTAYVYRVSAVNAIGEGPPREKSR